MTVFRARVRALTIMSHTVECEAVVKEMEILAESRISAAFPDSAEEPVKRRSWFAALSLALVPLAVLTAVPAAEAASSTSGGTAVHQSDNRLSRPHPELNGKRIKAVNGAAVYLVLDGKRRWIPNPATYNNLFRSWDGIQSVIDIGNIEDGGQLSDGAILGKSPNAPEVYLISNGVKRWITSPAAMDKYFFAWNKIASVPPGALGNIPTGAPIS